MDACDGATCDACAVVVTNPLSRLEVIMQTNSIKGKSISIFEACGEMAADMAKFGLSGIFRGQGIGTSTGLRR